MGSQTDLFVRVEYDPDFSGGDYDRVGRFAFIPVGMIEAHDGVEKAFTAQTGLPADCIVYYTVDENYTADGSLAKDL